MMENVILLIEEISVGDFNIILDILDMIVNIIGLVIENMVI